ncbi:MAG TPA: ISKra4 family transposase, partial [Sandaracinaceae bacterium LLY-WYZ-13_1]|nr:ISKra4 family transposase [Sandaracinaceae bacterium LLY-WYZ-13_1]
ALIDEVTFLENNKDRMRYASARAKGLPCGSGATEGACKSVVKVRACRPGQRWHAEGVDNILTLRALSQSERLPGAIEILRRDRYTAEVRPAA